MAIYKRVLLKLSGESLMGAQKYGLSTDVLSEYAAQIGAAASEGVQIAIVIGGGNIFRGLSGVGRGFDRVRGDQMGMLATVINSLALQSALEAAGTRARVLTSVRMEPVGELYTKARALELLAAGANGQYGLLRRLDDGRYAINIVLFDRDEAERAFAIYTERLPLVSDTIAAFVEENKAAYLAYPYLNRKVDLNLILWQQVFFMAHSGRTVFCRRAGAVPPLLGLRLSVLREGIRLRLGRNIGGKPLRLRKGAGG